MIVGLCLWLVASSTVCGVGFDYNLCVSGHGIGALVYINSVIGIMPHMIRSYYCCCCINESVIFSHCIHLKHHTDSMPC